MAEGLVNIFPVDTALDWLRNDHPKINLKGLVAQISESNGYRYNWFILAYQ